MKKFAPTIWALRDGKRGHENQVLGLAEAMVRHDGFEIEEIFLPHDEGLWKRFRRLREAMRELPAPRFVIAAGHSTHLPAVYAARRTGARSILLMKPSLPDRFFDLCLVPAHDLPRGVADNLRRIVTRGALNRVRYDPKQKDGRGLLLIGGPSREHGWDGEGLLEKLKEIVASDIGRKWVLTTSRRTPSDFLAKARKKLPVVERFDGAETPPDWLPAQLASAEVAWATQDSVSMVYEALSAGARVGLLDVPLRARPGKLTQGIESLIRDGYVVKWTSWRQEKLMPAPRVALAEADRCAEVILERFLKPSHRD